MYTSFNILKKNSKHCDETHKKYKLSIIGDCATQHINTALKGTAYLEQINLYIFETEYNQIFAQVMDSGSELYQSNCDAVLIVMCVEKLYQKFLDTPSNERDSFADVTVDFITQCWSSISTHSNMQIIQYNFPYFNDAIMGSFSLKEPSSFSYQLMRLNYLLCENCAKYKNVFLVDINNIKATYGQDIFHDDKMFYMAKLPFSLDILPSIAKYTIDIIKALLGQVKKCIVLDLDNTLWGGVIGDDGVEGIQIGELGTGQAFTNFQKWLKELKNRGVLLAVCSKNNEDIAQEAFLKHPEMILKLDDFAMFVANWENKASNILNIQQTLNLGMDSFVFIDDNPFERAQVASMISEITIPDLPEDPALYVNYLQKLNLFERVSFSNNDAQRTKQYQVEAKRTQMLNQYASYDEYLQSLDMIAIASAFDKFHYPRIAQLTQRSNQFNLRTIRYTETQIEEIAQNSNYITRYYTLKDKFGDHGLISVVILEKKDENILFINEWLMSCRVLKRGMEEFIVNDIINTAKNNGYSTVIGEYIQTKKNAMVSDIYEKMNFVKNDGLYYANISTFEYNKTFIKE